MALSDEIFILNDDERTDAFEELYLIKFGRLAHLDREAARLEALCKIKEDPKLMDEFYRAMEKNDIVKKAFVKGGKTVANAEMSHLLNGWVSKEIVKKTIGGGVDQIGRRGAVVVVERGAGLAASQGAHAAFNGVKLAGKLGKIATFMPGISAAIGQAIAEKVSNEIGVTNHHAKNAIAVGGAMAAGAAAGAIVGGPVGAAAGAGVGVVGWGLDKTLDALCTSGLGIKGPNDNWAYIDTGRVDGQICIGTYGPSDTMYWKTYWNEYRQSDCDMFVMSSGQAQAKSFQLCVWDSSNTKIHHFDTVFFRDFIHIGMKRNGSYCVAHGKGEMWGNEAGTVSLHP